MLRIAASAEKGSEHPLADAIVEEAKELNLELYDVENFEAIPVKQAKVKGKKYYLGNLRLINEQINIKNFEEISTKYADEGKPLYFADEFQCIRYNISGHIVKTSSGLAIKEFEAMGIEVVMLTGDNKKAAEAIRRQLGITRAVAEVLHWIRKEIRKFRNRAERLL